MVNPVVACSQISCTWDEDKNIDKAEQLINKAVKKGVNIFLLQELFTSPYFCSSQDPKFFKLAQPFENNNLIEKFSKIASKFSVVLPVSFFEKDKNSYYNSVAIIDSNGEVLGKYRKSHIPQNPGYEEKYYFSPGNSGFKVWETRVCKIGVGICWDQWFPEAARLTALKGAEIIFYPTAIGWHPKEKEKFGKTQLNSWLSVQKAHAIANGVYVAAVNRIGIEKQGSKKLEFWGNSIIFDPNGNILKKANTKESTIICEVDFKKVETTRRHWPFFRDRRIDSYKKILKNPIDG